jgi:hypothetical protein
VRKTLLFGLVLLAAVAVLGCPKRKPRHPGPPPRVKVLKVATIHAAADEKSEVVATVAKGDVLEVLKLAEKWSRVRTADGKEGFARRDAFGRRTLVAGGPGFGYTATVADRLRRVPEFDIVAVDTMEMMTGGVDAASQLARGRNVDLVVVVSGSMTGSEQLLYEVIDTANGTILGTGNTEAFLPLGQALGELTTDIYDIVHHGVPGPTASPKPSPSPGSSATPAPSELPHPNAPLPAASPSASPRPNPNAPLPAASPT